MSAGLAPAGGEEARRSSASPILPAPRTAIRRSVDRHARSLRPPCAPPRRAHAREVRSAPRDEAARPAEQRALAGEPLPLAVRREQRGGLLGPRPSGPERGEELDERRGRRRARGRSGRALERDHADRPRAEAALARETARGRRRSGGAQPLEIDARARAGRASTRAAARARGGAARAARAGERLLRGDASRRTPARSARSSARARRASISWPQKARSAACATVASRSGR